MGDIMKKSILLILIGKRKEEAVKVQQHTAGCYYKDNAWESHDGILDNCSDSGFGNFRASRNRRAETGNLRERSAVCFRVCHLRLSNLN